MYKVKAHLRYGHDIVFSERWQWQPQQQSHVRSFSVSGVIRGYDVYQLRIWMPHVGEKATMVREPGNEHDQSVSNSVMQYATE